jgi:hypothetical protein
VRAGRFPPRDLADNNCTPAPQRGAFKPRRNVAMSRILWVMLVISAASALAPSEAAAQHFSFSLGHGHHHHHGWHHDWHFDHCWHDPWCWGPHVDYVYLAPPRPRVVYVQPPAKEVRVEAAPVSSADSTWTAAAPRSLPANSGTLQIWNGAGRQVPVAFLVDAREVELADGQSHSLHGGQQRIVQFDRGGSFGTARYALTEGEYEFLITPRGWDLVRKRSAAAGISLKPIVKKNVLPEDTVTR